MINSGLRYEVVFTPIKEDVGEGKFEILCLFFCHERSQTRVKNVGSFYGSWPYNWKTEVKSLREASIKGGLAEVLKKSIIGKKDRAKLLDFAKGVYREKFPAPEENLNPFKKNQYT